MSVDVDLIQKSIQQSKERHIDARVNALAALGALIEHVADSRLDEIIEPWNGPHVLVGLGTAVKVLADEIGEELRPVEP